MRWTIQLVGACTQAAGIILAVILPTGAKPYGVMLAGIGLLMLGIGAKLGDGLAELR